MYSNFFVNTFFYFFVKNRNDLSKHYISGALIKSGMMRPAASGRIDQKVQFSPLLPSSAIFPRFLALKLSGLLIWSRPLHRQDQ